MNGARDFSVSTRKALAAKGLAVVDVAGIQEWDGLTSIYVLSDGRRLRFLEVLALAKS